MGGGCSTVWLCTIFETHYRELIAGSRHENRDEIYQGLGSSRVGLRHGDSHFWVIRRHKFNGVFCFLIRAKILQLNSRMRYTYVFFQIRLLS
jgi:hypothetical protein